MRRNYPLRILGPAGLALLNQREAAILLVPRHAMVGVGPPVFYLNRPPGGQSSRSQPPAQREPYNEIYQVH
jgi:hypothetical protein